MYNVTFYKTAISFSEFPITLVSFHVLVFNRLVVCFCSSTVPSWRSWSGTSSRKNQKPWWVLSQRVWGEHIHPAPWRWPLALLSPPQQTTPQSLEAPLWMTSSKKSGTNSSMRLRQSHVSLSRCIFAEVHTILSFN